MYFQNQQFDVKFRFPKSNLNRNISNDEINKENPNSNNSNVASCLTFIWNKNTKEFIGRTFLSWLQIFLFYIIFFVFLAIIFILMLFLVSVICFKETQPYLTGHMNILRLSPGINFLPEISSQTSARVVMSWFEETADAKEQKESYRDLINNWNQRVDGNQTIICSGVTDTRVPDKKLQACAVDTKDFGPCVDPLGQLKMGFVCIYVAMNRIYGWLPDLNNESIKGVTLDCAAVDAINNLNVNEIRYYPNKSGKGHFSHVFFPFLNQKNYQTAVLAIELDLRPGSLVFIECKIGNIELHEYRKYGKETFILEILYDA